MNILQVNKFYHIVGGVERYFFEVTKLLKKHHKIAVFSMHDERNKSSRWSKYFVSHVSFEKVDWENSCKVLGRMLYSFEARRKISKLLDEFKPDVAHIYNIYHQISPSILLELKKKGIPIVHTVGDYHLISPHHNNLFHNGTICEVTKIKRFYNAIIHKCVKNSYLASFAEVLEQYFHYMFGFYANNVDLFIAPSNFLAQKLYEYGIPKDKIVILPYFVDYDKFTPKFTSGNYILYFGRLYPEKGLSFLIDIMRHLPNINLKIVGRGPEGKSLKYKVKKYRLENVSINSTFVSDGELRRLIHNSRFTVFPSQSLEVLGISLLESYASGKPVVASKIGALPEIVKDEKTGFLFESGNMEDCIEKVKKLWNNLLLCREMGRNARRLVEENFGTEEHYKKLMEIYKKVIKKHK